MAHDADDMISVDVLASESQAENPSPMGSLLCGGASATTSTVASAATSIPHAARRDGHPIHKDEVEDDDRTLSPSPFAGFKRQASRKNDDEEDDGADESAGSFRTRRSSRRRLTTSSIPTKKPAAIKSSTADSNKPSPATQTLEHLSQSSAPLMYDMSQFEVDVAEALARVREDESVREELQSGNEDNDETGSNSNGAAKKISSSSSTSLARLSRSLNKSHQDQQRSTTRSKSLRTRSLAAATSVASRTTDSSPEMVSKTTSQPSSRKKTTTTTPSSASSRATASRGPKSSIPIRQRDPRTRRILGRFRSIRHAFDTTGIKRRWINDCLQGNRAEAGGYLWERDDDDVDIDEEQGDEGDDHEQEEHEELVPAAVASRPVTTKAPKKRPAAPLKGSTSAAATKRETSARSATAAVATASSVSTNKQERSTAKNKPAATTTKTTTTTAAAAKSQKKQVSRPPRDQYEIHHFTIHEKQRLGLGVSPYDPPKELLEACRSKKLVFDRYESACMITSVGDGSPAGAVGMQQGDWLLSASNATAAADAVAETSKILEFQEIRGFAKRKQRPITFCIARLKQQPNKQPSQKSLDTPSPDTSSSGADDKASSEAPRTGTVASKAKTTEESSKETTKGNEGSTNTTTLPFCGACNKFSRFHHPWCPQHKFFSKSGGEEILHRIQVGVKLGCSVCQQEFNDGRMLHDGQHSKECMQARAEEEASQTEDEDKDGQDGEGQNAKKKRSSSGNEESRTGNKRKLEETKPQQGARTQKISKQTSGGITRGKRQASTHGDGTGDRNKNNSNNNNSNKTKKSQLSSGETQEGARHVQASANVSQQPTAPRTTQARQRRAPIVQNEVPTQGVRAVNVGRGSRDNSSYTTSLQERPVVADEVMIEELDYDPHEKLKVEWVACDNPWGPEESLENDAVLFGPSPARHSSIGLSTQYETLLPSPRFVVNPFAQGMRYSKTHHTPTEGHEGLLLTRDLFSARPWGFACHRHEFGGACVVSFVEPLSPSETAVWLGDARAAPLRVYDMVLMINGKPVGGMTEVGFELEQEVSGTQLTLMVSRYKHTEKLQNRLQKIEKHSRQAMDRAINDDRLMDWTDIGAAIGSGTDTTSTSGQSEEEEEEPEVGQEPSERNHVVDLGFEDVEASKGCADSEDEVATGDACAAKARTSSPHLEPAVCCSQSSESDSQGAEPRLLEGQQFKPKKKSEDVGLKSNSSKSVNRITTTCADSGDEDTSGDDDAAEEEGAWLPCVCGDHHPSPIPLFWVQCDFCGSWYNVRSKCIGFKESEAADRDWQCHACNDLLRARSAVASAGEKDASVADNAKKLFVSERGQEANSPDSLSMSQSVLSTVPPKNSAKRNEDGTFKRPRGRAPEGHTWNESTGMWVEIPTEEAQTQMSARRANKPGHENGFKPDGQNHSKPFVTGDIVWITEHGWPGVNNEEGIAQVLKAYTDEDGDQLYDVKYVVGGVRRGLLAQYVREHYW